MKYLPYHLNHFELGLYYNEIGKNLSDMKYLGEGIQ